MNAQSRKWAAAQAADKTRLIELQPRRRVVRGWAFLYYRETADNNIVKEQIIRYLETGLRSDLPDSYYRLFDHVMETVLDGSFR